MKLLFPQIEIANAFSIYSFLNNAIKNIDMNSLLNIMIHHVPTTTLCDFVSLQFNIHCTTFDSQTFGEVIPHISALYIFQLTEHYLQVHAGFRRRPFARFTFI